jgi:hypothetical protein
MAISFGCDTEETGRGSALFLKTACLHVARDHDGVAPRDVLIAPARAARQRAAYMRRGNYATTMPVSSPTAR